MTPTDAEIADLYARYAPVIHHRARGILGSDEAAWDAVQETFARVIRHWDSFRHDASPLTWMSRITTNWCLNQLRNRRGRQDKHVVHRHDILGEEFARMPPPGEADLIRRLLEDADDETRRIVLHIYFDEMTRQETAELVGLSVPTVRKRLNHFLKRARRVLETPGGLAALGAAALIVLAASLVGSP